MKTFLEKFGSAGALIAAAACPICFPKIALIGAIFGLGVFAPYEGGLAIAVQVLFLAALAGQVLAFRTHRNPYPLAVAIGATLLLFLGYYAFGSTLLLQISVGGLVAASVWLFIENRRYATRAKGRESTQSVLTCPRCGFARQEMMPTDACLYFYECAGCGTLLTPRPGDEHAKATPV